MTIGVDPSIFNDPVIKTPATSLLMASLLNTLIDEDQCSFPANYTTEYTNDIKGKGSVSQSVSEVSSLKLVGLR